MKSRIFFYAVALAGLVLITGCKKNNPPPKSDEEIRTEELSGTWVLASGSDAVTLDGNPVADDWAGFTLTLGDKTYSTTNSFSAEVWPSSGSWAFKENTDGSTDVNTLVRDGALEIGTTVNESSLTMQFTYTASGGRLAGLEGDWIFKMVKQ